MRPHQLKKVFRAGRWMQEDGQDLVEYALVIGLLVLGITAGSTFLANQLSNTFSNIGTALTTNAS